MDATEVDSKASGLGLLPRRERYQSVVLAGSVRLVCDSSSGLRTLLCDLMGLTETRCLLRVYAQPDVGVAGRVEINMGNTACWLPIITRWTQPTTNGWALAIEFDRLTPEKRVLIHALVRERQIATAR